MNFKKLIIAVGVVLIALRLFFPVKEYDIKNESGTRINPDYIRKNLENTQRGYQWEQFQKSVIVSKTALQAFGIAVLTFGCAYLCHKKDSESSKQQTIKE